MIDDGRFHPGRRLLLVFAATAVLAFFGAFIIARRESRHDDILAPAAMGWMLGEFSILAVWGVFGPGNWFVRWLPSAAGGVFLGFCGLLGTACAQIARFSSDMTLFGPDLLLLPSFLIALQLPLFFLRFFGGLHIVSYDMTAHASSLRAGQFIVQDMLGLTTSLAVPLALHQTAISVWSNERPPISTSLWLTDVGVLALGSAAIIPPCLYAVFFARQRLVATLLACMGILAAVTAVAFVTSPYVRSNVRILEAVSDLSLVFVPLLAAIFAGLYLLPVCGYKMVRARKRVSPDGTDLEPPSGPAAGIFFLEWMKHDATAAREKRQQQNRG